MHFTTRKQNVWTTDTNNPSHKELTLDTITSATLQLEIYQEINTGRNFSIDLPLLLMLFCIWGENHWRQIRLVLSPGARRSVGDLWAVSRNGQQPDGEVTEMAKWDSLSLNFFGSKEIAITAVETTVWYDSLNGIWIIIIDRSSVSDSKSWMIMTHIMGTIYRYHESFNSGPSSRRGKTPMQAEFLDVDGDGLEDVITARCE